MRIQIQYKTTGTDRAVVFRSFNDTAEAVDYCEQWHKLLPTQHMQVIDADTPVGVLGLHILADFPPKFDRYTIEMPTGQNASILKWKLGCVHVSTPWKTVLKDICKGINNFRKLPKPLRRGVIKYVITEHRNNWQTYCEVVGGR
jgi:hypothetical protein